MLRPIYNVIVVHVVWPMMPILANIEQLYLCDELGFQCYEKYIYTHNKLMGLPSKKKKQLGLRLASL